MTRHDTTKIWKKVIVLVELRGGPDRDGMLSKSLSVSLETPINLCLSLRLMSSKNYKQIKQTNFINVNSRVGK